MKTRIVAAVFFLLWPVFDRANVGAATREEQDFFRKHVEEVQYQSPGKYQEMARRAGKNITACTDCHIDVAEKARRFGKP